MVIISESLSNFFWARLFVIGKDTEKKEYLVTSDARLSKQDAQSGP